MASNDLVKKTASLKIMIMNTGLKHESTCSAEDRITTIRSAVDISEAQLILWQEFSWEGINCKAWGKSGLSEKYGYKGHNHASMLFSNENVSVEEVSETLLKATLGELLITNKIAPFNPFTRMCLRKIKTKSTPVLEFICVSWHGRHKSKDRLEEFKSIVKYINKLSKKTLLPVVIAGDFNVKVKEIEKCVPTKLKIQKYQPTTKRKEEDIIDYFIHSKSLRMSEIKVVWKDNDTIDKKKREEFDHEPIESLLTLAEDVIATKNTITTKITTDTIQALERETGEVNKETRKTTTTTTKITTITKQPTGEILTRTTTTVEEWKPTEPNSNHKK